MAFFDVANLIVIFFTVRRRCCWPTVLSLNFTMLRKGKFRSSSWSHELRRSTKDLIHTNDLNHLNSGIPRYRILPDPLLIITSLAHSCARQFHPTGVHRFSLHFRQRQQPLDAQARDQPSAASNQITNRSAPTPRFCALHFDTNCKVD